jgi:hypothetical protein
MIKIENQQVSQYSTGFIQVVRKWFTVMCQPWESVVMG